VNNAEVRVVPEYGGYRAEYRKVHRSEWYPVKVNGVAQLFDTPEQAENAAYRALMKHIFGDGIVGSGEKASLAKAEAEKLFGKVFPGKGRKPVEVVRR